MRRTIQNKKELFTNGTRFIRNYSADRLNCKGKTVVVVINKFSPVFFRSIQSAKINTIEHCMTTGKEVA